MRGHEQVCLGPHARNRAGSFCLVASFGAYRRIPDELREDWCDQICGGLVSTPGSDGECDRPRVRNGSCGASARWLVTASSDQSRGHIQEERQTPCVNFGNFWHYVYYLLNVLGIRIISPFGVALRRDQAGKTSGISLPVLALLL